MRRRALAFFGATRWKRSGLMTVAGQTGRGLVSMIMIGSHQICDCRRVIRHHQSSGRSTQTRLSATPGKRAAPRPRDPRLCCDKWTAPTRRASPAGYAWVRVRPATARRRDRPPTRFADADARWPLQSPARPATSLCCNHAQSPAQPLVTRPRRPPWRCLAKHGVAGYRVADEANTRALPCALPCAAHPAVRVPALCPRALPRALAAALLRQAVRKLPPLPRRPPTLYRALAAVLLRQAVRQLPPLPRVAQRQRLHDSDFHFLMLQPPPGREERYCKFCESLLPDWRSQLFPEPLGGETTTGEMEVVFGNRRFR